MTRTRTGIAAALGILLVLLVLPWPAAGRSPALPSGAARWIVVLAAPGADRSGPAAVGARGPAPAGWAGPAAAGRAARALATRAGIRPAHVYRHLFAGFAATLAPAAVARLRHDPSVAAVLPDRRVTLARDPASPLVRRTRIGRQVIPTGIRRVGVLATDRVRIDGHDDAIDADVAVLDTGIAPSPDLRIAGGYDCTGPSREAWRDREGHGTHVAGTIAAKDDDGGVVGVAPGARLWAVKIIADDGSGWISWTLCGLERLLVMRDPDAPDRPRIEVANMSVGWWLPRQDDRDCGGPAGDIIHAAVCAVVADGTTVVVSAGNDGISTVTREPAAYDEVITVSALADFDGRPGGRGDQGAICPWYSADVDDTYGDFSNFGPDVDLIAPGKCILSTLPDGWYGWSTGTSMAAPHVAGAAALLAAAHPGTSPARIRRALVAAGTFRWATQTDPDGDPDRLLWIPGIGPLPDFTIDAAAPVDALAPGGIATIPVTLTRTGGHDERVTLSAPGPPPGIDAEVAASPIRGASATITLRNDGSATAGTVNVTVRASDGERVRTEVVPVVVRASGARAPFSAPAAGTETSVAGTSADVAVAETTPAAPGADRRIRRERADPDPHGGGSSVAWAADGPAADPATRDADGSPAGGWAFIDPIGDVTGCIRWSYRIDLLDGTSVRFVSGPLLRELADPGAPLVRAAGPGVLRDAAAATIWVAVATTSVRITALGTTAGTPLDAHAFTLPGTPAGWSVTVLPEPGPGTPAELARPAGGGDAVLEVRAVDVLARSSGPATIAVREDDRAPSVRRWTWPPMQGVTVTGYHPVLAWTPVRDVGSGAARLQQVAREVGIPVRRGSCVGADWSADGPPVSITVRHPEWDLVSGRCYRWTITPLDAVGNAGTPVRSGILLPDLVAPEGRFLAPAPGTEQVTTGAPFLLRWRDREVGGVGGGVTRRVEGERTPLRGTTCDAGAWRPFGSALVGPSPARTRRLASGWCYRWRLNLADDRGNPSAHLSGIVRVPGR
ncbi:MAG: S8 family serine peptidase [Chloroflexota bacterium]